MSLSKILTGARCKVGLFDPATGQTKVIGIFNNISYGLTYDVQPVYILGKYAPAETDYTSQEPVSITCSGWRAVGFGPHVSASLPKLQDLLQSEYISFTVLDRQLEATGKDARVAKFEQVRSTGYSTTISARQMVEVSMTFVGILVSDESATNNEHPSAAFLP